MNKVLDVKPLVPLFIKKYANSLTNICLTPGARLPVLGPFHMVVVPNEYI